MTVSGEMTLFVTVVKWTLTNFQQKHWDEEKGFSMYLVVTVVNACIVHHFLIIQPDRNVVIT